MYILKATYQINPKIALLQFDFWFDTIEFSHMGHFPQDRENEQNLSEFFCFWSFTVTKRFDLFKFSQLFWRDYVRWSLQILSFTLQQARKLQDAQAEKLRSLQAKKLTW